MSLSFTTVDDIVGEKLDEIFGVKYSFLRVNPGQCLLPPQYAYFGPRIRDMEIRTDDIWLVSYPRTGSHWVQEMVWCIGNNFDYDINTANRPIILRNPLLESSAIMVNGDYKEWFFSQGNSVKNVQNMPSPRYVKSHLPWCLLPKEIHLKKPKIIYITRNPKDTCVSFYHYLKTFHNAKTTFEDFAELFLEDNAPMGSFWNHVLKFWTNRHQENILFLTYEEMKKDQTGVIKKTAKFLNQIVTDEQVTELCKHLKFSKMAVNPAFNLQNLLRGNETQDDNSNTKFLRKGIIGDWRNHMSKELARRFDKWTKKNLEGTGLELESTISYEAE